MNRIFGLVSITGLVVLAGACWPEPGAGPDRRAHNSYEEDLTVDTVSELEYIWSLDTEYPVSNDVIAADGTVYVHDILNVYAIDAVTGSLEWSVSPSTDDTYYLGSMILTNEYLYASSGTLDADGWRTQLHDLGTGAEVGDSGAGMLHTKRGSMVVGMQPLLYGDMLWYLEIDDPDVPSHWSGIVAVDDGEEPDLPVPVTVSEQFAYHVGEGILATEPGDDAMGYRVGAYPISGADTNCGASDAAVFACPTWVVPLAGRPAGPAVLSADGATMFVVANVETDQDEESILYAIDAVTGEVAWTGEIDSSAGAAPALADGKLYVPAGGSLVVFAEEGCEGSQCDVLWSADVSRPSGIDHQPAVSGTGTAAVVVTAASSGEIHAFAADGCEEQDEAPCVPLWSSQLESEITAAPAIADGHIYVSTWDGVQAFGLPADDA